MEILVERAALADGEDLMDFANKLMRAVADNASIFGAEPGNIYVVAGYKDTVVVRDYAKDRYVRANYKRKSDAEFVFTKAMIVRKAWEEVMTLEDADNVQRTEADGGEIERATVEVEVPEPKKFWDGVL